MIDVIDNSIQILVVGICTVVTFIHAVTSGRKAWILLGFFYGSSFAGTLYWQIYVALYYRDTPFNTFIADLAWNTAYLFLILLLMLVKRGKISHHPPVAMILVPAFTVGMGAYYMTFGSIVTNLVTMVLMTILILTAIDGLVLINKGEGIRKEKKKLYIVTLLFCFVEYAMWTCSCIWTESTITNPYYYFDILLSVCYILFIPALRKAVGR